MDAILVAIHHHQLSTFFFAISHMPVKAVADAKASAQGMVAESNAFFRDTPLDLVAESPALHDYGGRRGLATWREAEGLPP